MRAVIFRHAGIFAVNSAFFGCNTVKSARSLLIFSRYDAIIEIYEPKKE